MDMRRLFLAGWFLLIAGCVEPVALLGGCPADDGEWQAKYGHIPTQVFNRGWPDVSANATVPVDWWFPAEIQAAGGDPTLPYFPNWAPESMNLSQRAQDLQQEARRLEMEDRAYGTDHSAEIRELREEAARLVAEREALDEAWRQKVNEREAEHRARFLSFLEADLVNSTRGIRPLGADFSGVRLNVTSAEDAQWLLDRPYLVALSHLDLQRLEPHSCPL